MKPKAYEEKVVYEEGYHPWRVYVWLPPVGFWEVLKYRLGFGRQDYWLPIFSSDTEIEARDFLAKRKVETGA